MGSFGSVDAAGAVGSSRASTPSMKAVITQPVPPEDTSGNAMPLAGASPVTTSRFMSVWRETIAMMPSANNCRSGRTCDVTMRQPAQSRVMKRPTSKVVPSRPNSSVMIEKMKSVVSSGR